MAIRISEIIEKAAKAKKKEEKINILRENDSEALRTVLCFALHPQVKSNLPDGPAPYKPAELADENYGMLYTAYRKLPHFCEGVQDNLTKTKRENLFIQTLEAIHPKDAELLVAAKDKKLPYKGLPISTIEEAFPGIFD